MRLDLGCGAVTPSGWTGVDISLDVGAAIVHDLTVEPWPVPNDSVAEARCHHFFEHLTPPQRAAFMRQAYRVLLPGAKITLTTPLGFNRMVQDPDHKWPPVVKGTYYYYSRAWRDANALSHYETLYGLTMDLELVSAEIKYDPSQYKPETPPAHLELLLLADPDAQTDLVTVLRKVDP